MDDTGYHYFIDAKLRSPAILGDRAALRRLFECALEGFTVIGFIDHKFGAEGGVTGIFLLAESHCSYHTYPESRYIAIDVFTCGREPTAVTERLLDSLGCESKTVRYNTRGTISLPSSHTATSGGEASPAASLSV